MAKRTIELPPGELYPRTPSGASLRIEVFGATGDFNSGKTLLGLSIAPGVHPEGHAHAGKPRTCYFDFEKSGATFGGTGCHRIDVPAKLQDLNTDKSGHVKPYGSIDVYKWFVNEIDNMPPARWDVIMADPITDVEAGLAEFIRKNPEKFGMTAKQVEKAGGIFWGAVKDTWKGLLLKLASRCQTFYYTAHLRTVFENNLPTNKREPKGKETLLELSSLYLWLERKPDKSGAVADKPAATVLKQRLSDTFVDAESGELRIVPLMPPRIPVATIGEIRRYIAAPPDYAKLKPEERVVEEQITEEQTLQLKLATAQAEQAAEESRLQVISRRLELQRAQHEYQQQQPQSPDQSAQVKAAAESKRAESVERAQTEQQQDEVEAAKQKAQERMAAGDAETKRLMENNPTSADPATRSQVLEAQSRMKACGMPPEVLKAKLVAAGAQKVSELSREACHKLLEAMRQWEEMVGLLKQLNVEESKLLTILERANAKSIWDLKEGPRKTLLEKLRERAGGDAAKN